MSSISKSRRKFITDTAKGTIAAGIGLTAAGSFITSCATGKNIAQKIMLPVSTSNHCPTNTMHWKI